MVTRLRSLHEAQGIRTEATLKFMTAVVRFWADFDSSVAHSKAGPYRKIGGGNVEFDNEIVSGSGQGLAVCYQPGDIVPNHRELCVRMARVPPIPLISGHTFLRCQAYLGQSLVNARCMPTNNEHQTTLVGRRRRQPSKLLFQFPSSAMQLGGVILHAGQA